MSDQNPGRQKEITKTCFQVRLKESTIFAIKGAMVDKVTLTVNDSLLSVFKPTYSADILNAMEYSDVEPPQIDVNFFRTVDETVVPYHGALGPNWKIRIDVYVMYYNSFSKYLTPSLMMGTADYNMTWSDPKVQNIDGCCVYSENVLVGSDSGEKKFKLVYTADYCGFLDI